MIHWRIFCQKFEVFILSRYIVSNLFRIRYLLMSFFPPPRASFACNTSSRHLRQSLLLSSLRSSFMNNDDLFPKPEQTFRLKRRFIQTFPLVQTAERVVPAVHVLITDWPQFYCLSFFFVCELQSF